MRITLAIAATIASPAVAQEQCRVPDRLPAAVPERVDTRAVRNMPITDYSLALSWSPQHCRTARDTQQCGRGARFGWVLHGLWPEGAGRSWPQYCRPAGALPARVVRENFCMTPSVQLQQHEWQKHGSCMTADAAAYFQTARQSFNKLRFPDMRGLTQARPDVTSFTAAFAAANRGMRPEMLRVKLSNGGWLEEVRVCLDKRFRPIPCSADTPGARSRQRVRIWQQPR